MPTQISCRSFVHPEAAERTLWFCTWIPSLDPLQCRALLYTGDGWGCAFEGLKSCGQEVFPGTLQGNTRCQPGKSILEKGKHTCKGPEAWSRVPLVGVCVKHEWGVRGTQQVRGWREGQNKSMQHTDPRSWTSYRRKWETGRFLTQLTHLDFHFRKISLGELEEGVGEEVLSRRPGQRCPSTLAKNWWWRHGHKALSTSSVNENFIFSAQLRTVFPHARPFSSEHQLIFFLMCYPLFTLETEKTQREWLLWVANS